MSNKKYEKLLNLIKENPTLRVIPLVEQEVVGDDSYGYWYASFGDCYIEEVTMYHFIGDDYEIMTSDKDKIEEDMVERYADEHDNDINIEADIKSQMKELKWEKVITVYVETP